LSSAGTGFFYVTSKNPKNVANKLVLKKVSTYLLVFDAMNINSKIASMIRSCDNMSFLLKPNWN